VRSRTLFRSALASLAVTAAATVGAQQPVVAASPAVVLNAGDAAPDFDLRGATRYGLLATPVRLADHKGETVVIAFFYKARTKG
jgi:peroxiredoxin Q/BCP